MMAKPWNWVGSYKDITNYVSPSVTDVALVSLYSIILLFINQFIAAKWYEFRIPL